MRRPPVSSAGRLRIEGNVALMKPPPSLRGREIDGAEASGTSFRMVSQTGRSVFIRARPGAARAGALLRCDQCTLLGHMLCRFRPWNLRAKLKAGEGGLRSDSWVQCDQLTTVEKSRAFYPPLARPSFQGCIDCGWRCNKALSGTDVEHSG